MAKRISELNRRASYPWHEWQDGDKWQVYRGTDYQLSTESFRATVLLRAKTRGLKATTRVDDKGNSLQFQFYRETPGDLLPSSEPPAQDTETAGTAD